MSFGNVCNGMNHSCYRPKCGAFFFGSPLFVAVLFLIPINCPKYGPKPLGEHVLKLATKVIDYIPWIGPRLKLLYSLTKSYCLVGHYKVDRINEVKIIRQLVETVVPNGPEATLNFIDIAGWSGTNSISIGNEKAMAVRKVIRQMLNDDTPHIPVTIPNAINLKGCKKPCNKGFCSKIRRTYPGHVMILNEYALADISEREPVFDSQLPTKELPRCGKEISKWNLNTTDLLVVELGTYIGYGAVVLGSTVAKHNGKVVTVDPNGFITSLASRVVKHSQLNNIHFECTTAETAINEIAEEGLTVGILLVDHIKNRYIQDIQLALDLGILKSGSLIIVDNCKFPEPRQYVISKYNISHFFSLSNYLQSLNDAKVVTKIEASTFVEYSNIPDTINFLQVN